MTERRHKRAPVPAGTILRRAAGAAFRRRGFAEGEVIARWPAIVGEQLAALTVPEKIVQRRGDAGGAVLHVRVAGAAAVELQHQAPMLIERINTFYGYHAVDRLQLVQGPLPARPAGDKPAPAPLSPAAATALDETVSATRSEGLRLALRRLGAGVMGRRRDSGQDAT
ncbi:MAG: DciA family protein [Alphaproteobacteria bacterium]|jgi:hypothetical protein|nr:DciA family protein [Alphaproteobacteria bacterium]MDP6566412.1 DciA family protein [Alphaproteobacteria bacterium]MDP6811630.1 DciA family protein [Alphaproteobacteria bacterium]